MDIVADRFLQEQKPSTKWYESCENTEVHGLIMFQVPNHGILWIEFLHVKVPRHK